MAYCFIYVYIYIWYVYIIYIYIFVCVNNIYIYWFSIGAHTLFDSFMHVPCLPLYMSLDLPGIWPVVMAGIV